MLVINSGEPEAVQKWADEVQAEFPVLRQEKLSVSEMLRRLRHTFRFSD